MAAKVTKAGLRFTTDEIERLPAVLITSEVARIVGWSDQHVERSAKAGKLPGHKVGRCWMFNKDEILALVGLV